MLLYEQYDHFHIQQGFGVHRMRISAHPVATIIVCYANVSINVNVGFVCPQNNPWLRITNRHSHEKFYLECFESFKNIRVLRIFVPFQLLNSLTLMWVRVQNSTHNISNRR